MMQYITGRGLTEVDDVINNIFGTVIGFIIYIVIHRALEHQNSEL